MGAKKKINILVIEDNEDDRLFIEGYIKEMGDMNYNIVGNAEQFADKMDSNIHIVILDHLIVEKTGLELIPAIKGRSEFPFIIIYTGYQDNEVTMKYLNSGANRIVGKWQKNKKGEVDHGREILKQFISDGIEIIENRLDVARDLKSLKNNSND